MLQENNNFTVRSTWAYEFSVRLNVTVGDRLYDVHVDALGDGYDVEVYDETYGDPVDAGDFAGLFGFASLHKFAEALTDGFYLEGPPEFTLLTPSVVAR